MPKGLIVKDGYKLIGITLLIAIIIAYFYSIKIAVIPFVLAVFFTFFFRNPKRNIPIDPNVLVSPADGKVMDISEEVEEGFLHHKCKKITIFLSVFDVHVNRAPMAGKITFRDYTCGEFLPAYKENVGFINERHSICIDNGKFAIVVTQIAGLLARRIVSWICLGDSVDKGQLYGMIKFGSCTEIFVPENIEICVKKGDRVKGGESIIGRVISE